jgi:hypothetical protein
MSSVNHDLKAMLERLPNETVYFLNHRLEQGCGLVGFVLRNPVSKEVAVIFDKDCRILTESEAKRLLHPQT